MRDPNGVPFDNKVRRDTVRKSRSTIEAQWTRRDIKHEVELQQKWRRNLINTISQPNETRHEATWKHGRDTRADETNDIGKTITLKPTVKNNTSAVTKQHEGDLQQRAGL